MHPADPYGARDDDGSDELPPLPIPRPGEAPVGRSQETEPPAPHRLGGGASYTAARSRDTGELPTPPPARAVHPTPGQAVSPGLDEPSLTWQLAAQLTAGMLANPAKANASVKDAMGLFDKFLLEVDAYVRIASGIDRGAAEDERRRAHSAYFRSGADTDDGSTDRHDAGHTGAHGPSQQPQQPTTPRPAPERPRPPADYRPIPPGMRGPYSPGSMAGSPPPDDPDADSDPVRRAA